MHVTNEYCMRWIRPSPAVFCFVFFTAAQHRCFRLVKEDVQHLTLGTKGDLHPSVKMFPIVPNVTVKNLLVNIHFLFKKSSSECSVVPFLLPLIYMFKIIPSKILALHPSSGTKCLISHTWAAWEEEEGGSWRGGKLGMKAEKGGSSRGKEAHRRGRGVLSVERRSRK